MALHETRTRKGGQDETIGPRMHDGGYSQGDPSFGPNPADTLRTGPLPVRPATPAPQSYPIDRGQVVSLYRGESTPGTKEGWRAEYPGSAGGPSPEDYCQPKPLNGAKAEENDPGAAKFGKQPPAAASPANPEFGLHGGRIYGT